MNEASSLDFHSDEEDEDVEQWDSSKRTVTTWQASTTATRPPRKTFASRFKQRGATRHAPSARKALDLGGSDKTMAAAEQSHRMLPDHTASKIKSSSNNNKPMYSPPPPRTPSTPVHNHNNSSRIAKGNREEEENTPNFSSSSQFLPSNSSSSLSMSMSIPSKPRAARNLSSSNSDILMSPQSPLDVPNLERKSRTLGTQRVMTRANTLPPLPTANAATMSQPPKGQKQPRYRRSLSLALGSPPPLPAAVGALDESAEAPPFWEEALAQPKSPEEMEAELLEGGSRRKKPRARRASMQGTLADLFQQQQIPLHDFKDTLSSPPIPPPRHLSSPSKSMPARSSSEVIVDYSSSIGGGGAGSPSASSRASSGRKRGYCGSPAGSDNMDDQSLGGMSSSMNSNASRRSRSRIFAASSPILPPSVALLDHTKQTHASASSKRRQNKKTAPYRPDECRGMDDSSDDEHEDDLLDNDSGDDEQHPADMSMEEDDDHCGEAPFSSCAVPLITINTATKDTSNDKEDENAKTAGDVIFERMSSYADLKFLIRKLRKAAGTKSKVAAGFFGGGSGVKSWTVAPDSRWEGPRRAAFLKWTISQFGFEPWNLGNSMTALRISSAKGESLLQKLEDALVEYKEKTTTLDNEPLMDNPDNMSSPPFVSQATPASIRPPFARPVKKQLNRNCNDAAAADELTAGLQSLSVQEHQPRPSDVSLHVGGDFIEAISVDNPQPSFDPSVGAVRPSFEQHSVVGATDMMMHMHGHSPEKEEENEEESPSGETRQPKLSMASVASNYSRGRPSAPHAPIQNLELIETPQIKQDEGWGSRPVEGKDWGTSPRCEDTILETLTERIKEAELVAGKRVESCDGAGESYSGLPVMPGGLDMEDNVVDNAVGFDKGDNDMEEEDDVVMQEDEGDDVKAEDLAQDGRKARRRQMSFAKHQRVSLYAAGSQDAILPGRKSAFPVRPARHSFGAVEESARSLHEYEDSFPIREVSSCIDEESESFSNHPEAISKKVASNESLLVSIFSFLTESELLCKASTVSTTWAKAATTAHAALMMASVGYMDADGDDDHGSNADDDEAELGCVERPSVSVSMDRDWRYLNRLFPWACFLSSGAFKRVFKVFNAAVQEEEAVSVMDVEAISDKKTIASELVVTAMLSAMSRRGIAPNFVIMHGVFTLPYDVPESIWGTETNKKPKGAKYKPGSRKGRAPRQPKEAFPGRYQFIRMELCDGGDMEEHLKKQKDECFHQEVARSSLFQIAFALHAAGDRHALKHYDIKLLNVFVQGLDVETPNVVLRYGLGSHVFALDLPRESAFFAKLADYGTANVQPESTGLPVTIAQFTTLENTPPDYLILGDEATQGHGHDNFGLGLCMLHLFTGHAPYEEILEDVVCPPMLKKKLRAVWENEKSAFSVLRSVILADVYKDERGHIIEGEPDETLYDTLYRFLVLFGIPAEPDRFDQRRCPTVWKAITDTLEARTTKAGRRQKHGTDVAQFERDSSKYSIHWGNNVYIARARRVLEAMEGGMDLLLRLCSFNPNTRATSLQVLNSPFMEALREKPATHYSRKDTVFSYTSFSTV